MSRVLAGIDEAGRGPLAGPVVAAAVILPARCTIPVTDSKQLSAARRAALAAQIREEAECWGIGVASTAEIDRLNILNATMRAMTRAFDALEVSGCEVLIDGDRCPGDLPAARAVVGGDAAIPAISAASILAKTVRDAFMELLAGRYPGYGFDRHKGYATAEHLAALARLGPAPCHRRSFAPVRLALGPVDVS